MILYLIQVTAYTGAMLVLYQLLLRDRPIHGFNRMYLLSACILPVILPLLKLPGGLRPKQDAKPLVAMLQEVTVGGAAVQGDFPVWLLMIPVAYLVVTLTILVVKLAGFLKMQKVIYRSEKEQHAGYTLLKHTGYGPGSWGSYIFLPGGDVDAIIVQHELSHVRLRHSRDIIFVSLLQAILWPNVFIHLLKKELVQVHEFQADAAVGVSGEDYTKLLLSSIFGTCTLPFTHSFIIHPIKRRIMMLHNNQKNGKTRGIIASLSAVLLLGGIVTMQSCEQKKEAESKTEKTNDSVFTYVHKMPDPGYNLSEKLGKLIEYPEEAKQQQIEGRVPVTFVVGKDGKISGMEVKGKNIDPLLRDAAIKAIAQLPDWIPGEDEHGNKVAVYFTLPINFKLDEKDKKTTHTKLNAREVEVGKRQLQREVAALTGSNMPVKLDISDPTHRKILAQVHSLLSEVTNGPIFVNPKE
ncbi:MAG TPA: M56 family metallopeptidase [Flavipsychrobacter sp.]